MDLTPTSTPVLRDPMKTMDATVQYMRDVTILVISQIAWHRGLCPETSFKKKYLLNNEFNILKVTNNAVVNYLFKNMAGAFEALKRHYLKSLTMNIKNATGEFLLETYTMTYTYEYDCESSMSLDISSVSGSSSKSGNSVQQSPTSRVYISTLDMLLKLKESLTEVVDKSLPDETVLDFGLSYYDHTPRDYTPPGFRFHTEGELQNSGKFLEESLRFRQGRIRSAFGKISCSSQFTGSLIHHSDEDAVQPSRY